MDILAPVPKKLQQLNASTDQKPQPKNSMLTAIVLRIHPPHPLFPSIPHVSLPPSLIPPSPTHAVTSSTTIVHVPYPSFNVYLLEMNRLSLVGYITIL
jgi:hypothetical protein